MPLSLPRCKLYRPETLFQLLIPALLIRKNIRIFDAGAGFSHHLSHGIAPFLIVRGFLMAVGNKLVFHHKLEAKGQNSDEFAYYIFIRISTNTLHGMVTGVKGMASDRRMPCPGRSLFAQPSGQDPDVNYAIQNEDGQPRQN